MTERGGTIPGELAGQLQLKIALLEELQALLARETAALASGGHEHMIGIAEDKQRLVAHLKDLSQALNERLSRAGYSADGSGLEKCIHETAGGAALAGLYERAMKALRACEAHNQTNGGLVERRRSAVDRALRILFDRPDGTTRYHPSGRLEGAGPNRLIAEA